MTTSKKLILVLTIGLILRAGLLIFYWDKPLTIVDEKQYQQLSENILKHHEYAFHHGRPTSLRPPLYPAFLSAVYFFTGGIHYNAVRITQILLSLGSIWMVFILGRKIFDEKTGVLAAFIFAVYPSFLFFTHFLLTEVLFTLFLLLFVYFFISFLDASYNPKEGAMSTLSSQNVDSPTSLPTASRVMRYALLSGFFLGLGALTRSIMYPFLVVAILFAIVFARTTPGYKLKGTILLIVGFIMVVGPWAGRNYNLYKDFVPVGTMGGLNLFMGNYEHTPLNRAWAAVDLTGEKAWHYGYEEILSKMNEAQKQKWASKKAKEYILDHKLLTVKRAIIKAANFWGLERAVIGPIINDHWPSLKKTPYLIVITLSIFSAFAVVTIGSFFGIMFNLMSKKYDIFLTILLLGYFTGMHAIVFGHSRYHLPLIPMMSLFAAWSLRNVTEIFARRNEWRQRVSIFVSIILIAIWIREIIFVEGARYIGNLRL
jgi:4-amino-4-deoxy-L-arabinose transferase-like glycosyltransferase